MKSLCSTVVAALPLLFLLACDPAVDRFEENQLHYSVFGYLHASADTQFVRVEWLRDSLFTRAPETLNAEVTLTTLTTDRTVSLQDSVFRFRGEATAHNFYTTADIDPATPYRLIVRGPEGESRVQTTLPSRFPAPSVETPISSCFPNCPGSGPPDCSGAENESRFATIRIEDIERVVAVRALYYLEEPRGVWSFGHLADTTHTGGGAVRAQIDFGDDWCKITDGGEDEVQLRNVKAVVAAGSSDWPEFVELDLETELLPGIGSNVDGGVGFLGGIVTDTVVVTATEE